MFYTQDGSWVNAQNIEIWKIKALKGDLHQLIGIGNSEYEIHTAPKVNCEDVLSQVESHVKEGHDIDLRGRDQEHLKAAQAKPKRTSRSKTKTAETKPTETDETSE